MIKSYHLENWSPWPTLSGAGPRRLNLNVSSEGIDVESDGSCFHILRVGSRMIQCKADKVDSDYRLYVLVHVV